MTRTSVTFKDEVYEVLTEMKNQGIIHSRDGFINEAVAYYLMELTKLELEARSGHNEDARTT